MTENPYPHIFNDPAPASLEAQRPFPPGVPAPAPSQPRSDTEVVPTHKQVQAVWFDFVLVLLFCLLLGGAVYANPAMPALALLRLALAVIFVLIVPGYSLTAVLFPGQDDLDGIERAGLSLGLSVALAPVVALVLDRAGLGLGLMSILLALMGLSLGLMALALILRARLPAGRAYAQAPSGMIRLDRRAVLILGTVLIAAAGVVTWLYFAALNPSKTTEFYLLGPSGLAEEYPRQATVGQALAVTVGITSRERTEQAFVVEVRNHSELVGLGGPYLLQPGETLQVPLEFYALHAGDDQAFTFILVWDDPQQPERVLELWLDVNGPAGN